MQNYLAQINENLANGAYNGLISHFELNENNYLPFTIYWASGGFSDYFYNSGCEYDIVLELANL